MNKALSTGGKQSGLGELMARLRFVLLAIIIYRVGTHIPVPGMNPYQIAAMFDQSTGTVRGLLNMSSAGSLQRMSLFT